jgi:RNA polymerase sigma-70 factor (ECF subfamily)
LAEDAAAEGLARAFQHWSRVSRFESPAGWAYRAGLNWALSLLRRRRRESRRSIDDVVHLEEPDPTIYAALQGLDLNHRRVVVMR